MTNTLSMNAQHAASASVPQRRDWKKPVLEVLSLEDAQHGTFTHHDAFQAHKSN